MEKIIHQTWKNNELKETEREWVESVKKAFRGYEYKFWTDEDNDRLIRAKYPEFSDFYKTLKPVEKADFCRYLYIFDYGGIYLDIDVKMNKFLPLDNADVFLCDQTKENDWTKFESDLLIDPFFVAGKKGCPFFYNLCSAISRGTIYKILSLNHDLTDTVKTLYKTGPVMLTKYYLLSKHKYHIKVLVGMFTTDKCVTKIPKDLFYGIHMQSNTWIERKK